VKTQGKEQTIAKTRRWANAKQKNKKQNIMKNKQNTS
jgi:hypothetical protein